MEIKSGYIKNKLGEKHIVVPTGEAAKGASENLMIKLNDSASEIWDMISGGMSIEEAADKLVEKYEVGKEKALADVQKIVDKMKEIEAFK